MKPSKMTNEKLAENIEAIPPFLIKAARNLTDADDCLREAAKRLRVMGNVETALKFYKRRLTSAKSVVDTLKTDNDRLHKAIDNIYKCVDNRFGVDVTTLVKNIIADALDMNKKL